MSEKKKSFVAFLAGFLLGVVATVGLFQYQLHKLNELIGASFDIHESTLQRLNALEGRREQ